MSRRVGYLLAAAILICSFGAAGLLIAQRPELSLRPSDVRIPAASRTRQRTAARFG